MLLPCIAVVQSGSKNKQTKANQKQKQKNQKKKNQFKT